MLFSHVIASLYTEPEKRTELTLDRHYEPVKQSSDLS